MKRNIALEGPDLGKNEQRLLQLLRTRGAQTASELARLSGLGKATVSRLVARLREDGIVEETGLLQEKRGRGRIGTLLHIRSESELYLGLNIRSDSIEAVLLNVSRDVLLHWSRETQHPESRQERLALLADTCRQTVAKAGRDISRLRGVGIAMPAPIHPVTHEIGPAVRIPQWQGAGFGSDLSEMLGVPVTVENDSNCAAMYEIASGGQEHGETFAYIHLDRGVGGALVLDGAIWRGFTGRAGNFGHVPYDPNGELCRCGARGCYEKYLSIPALLKRLAPICGEVDFQYVRTALAAGDPAVKRAVEDSGVVLGTLMAGLSRSFDPPNFVLGGRMAELGAAFTGPAQAQLASLSQAAGSVHRSTISPDQATRAVAIGAVIVLIAAEAEGRLALIPA